MREKTRGKSLSQWLSEISVLSYIILKAGFLISCLLLSLALLLFTIGGGLSLENFSNYLLAKELSSIPVIILFISVIGVVCIEDLRRK